MDQRWDITGTQMFPPLLFCISPQATRVTVPARKLLYFFKSSWLPLNTSLYTSGKIHRENLSIKIKLYYSKAVNQKLAQIQNYFANPHLRPGSAVCSEPREMSRKQLLQPQGRRVRGCTATGLGKVKHARLKHRRLSSGPILLPSLPTNSNRRAAQPQKLRSVVKDRTA